MTALATKVVGAAALWTTLLGAQVGRPTYPTTVGRVEGYIVEHHLAAGVELLPNDVANPGAKELPPRAWFNDMSTTEVLDLLLAPDPRYEWSKPDLAFRVGPKLAPPATSFLDRRFDRFSISQATVTDVFTAIHRLFNPSFVPSPSARMPTNPYLSVERARQRERELAATSTMTLRDVTLRDILDAIVLDRGDSYWKVQYSKSPASYQTSLIQICGFDGWVMATGAPQP